MPSRTAAWLSDRFGARPILKHVLLRRVPRGSWYFGDGATLTALLCVLIVTGALMALTYSPDIDSAHSSVAYLSDEQLLGWLVRGLHYWSAGLMVVMILFHLFRQILIGGYKAPREGTWLVGVPLLAAVLLMSFTGYILRWDENALGAIKVVTHMLYNIPVIGDWLVILVQGGREIGPLTLTRIYGTHIIALPLLILGLVGFHLYLVVLNGTTSPSEQDENAASAKEQRSLYKRDIRSEDRGESFYPETMGKSSIMAYIVIGLAFLFTFFLGPPEIRPEATEYLQRSRLTEEWWFWWYSGLIALLPPAIAPGFVVVFPIVVFLSLVLLPFVDRGPRRGISDRPIAITFVTGTVIALLILSSIRYASAWTPFPVDEPPPNPPNVILSADAEADRILFSRYGCTTCHAVGGHGRTVAVDIAAIDPPLAESELEEFIRNPPAGIAMPSYNRLPQEDIDRLVSYVLAAQTFRERY